MKRLYLRLALSQRPTIEQYYHELSMWPRGPQGKACGKASANLFLTVIPLSVTVRFRGRNCSSVTAVCIT